MNLLAAIIENTDDAVYTKSPDGTITSWNAAAQRLYGLTPEEAIGRPVAIIVPPEHAGEDVMILARILTGEKIDHFETERMAKDGRRVRVSMTVSPLRGEDGAVAGASVIARDITERRRSQDATALLAAIVESSDDAIYTKTAQGIISSWNSGAQQLYGYAPVEAIGQPVAMIIPPHRAGEDTVILARILKGERIEHFETERLHKDGSIVPVSVTASPILGPDGTVRGASMVARDVAERRALEVERARHLAALEDYNTIIAHDLTEPLRTITGYATWMEARSAAIDDRTREALDHMRAAAARMQGLIDGLRQYARLGSTVLDDERPVPLGDVVRDVLATLDRALADAGAEVEVGELPEVCGDAVLLGQLFQNLVENAVKFRGAEPPRIAIDAVRKDDCHVLRVSDNGIGLDPADAGRVFGMYERLHPRERFDGLGVGLAVARRIAERHDGRLWFEPREGGGTRFCLSLPA